MQAGKYWYIRGNGASSVRHITRIPILAHDNLTVPLSETVRSSSEKMPIGAEELGEDKRHGCFYDILLSCSGLDACCFRVLCSS